MAQFILTHLCPKNQTYIVFNPTMNLMYTGEFVIVATEWLISFCLNLIKLFNFEGMMFNILQKLHQQK